MDMLHRLYNKFDALTAHFNLFKVETIGDAVRALFLLPDLTVTCPRAWALALRGPGSFQTLCLSSLNLDKRLLVWYA